MIKTTAELAVMKEGGRLLAHTLQILLKEAKVGTTTKELDTLAEQLLRAEGGIPSFKGYEGFPSTICTSLQDGLVHGIPDNRKLQNGDVLSIDIGVLYKQFHTDLSDTIIIGQNKVKDKQIERFLLAGKRSLAAAIAELQIGKRIGDISAAMQYEIERDGYSVSRIFTGHGIGKELHEDPYIPCFGRKNTGMKILEGMVLAIEVIYAAGSAEAVTDTDGWTARTKDGSLGGLFEHTVAVTKNGPLVLTKE